MSHRKYSDGNEGKCRYCGFLSKHARHPAGLPSPRFYEMEHSERIDGRFDNHAVAYGKLADTEPMCFLEVVNFEAINQDQGRAKLLEEINADRQCKSWYPYMAGLSPKEHYEELQMQRLEHDRREFERKLSDMGLRAHEANATILESQLKIVSDLKDIAGQTDRFQRRVTLWIITFAIVQVLIAIAVYLFPRESYTDQLLRKLFG